MSYTTDLPSLRTGGLGEKQGGGYVSTHSLVEPQSRPTRRPNGITSASSAVQSWTSIALLVSYFVFSVAFYTVLSDYDNKVFWFLYLTISFLVAGVTALEAYDGLTPLREARKAIEKADADGWKFKTGEDALPSMHLIFDYGDTEVPEDLSSITRLDGSLMYPAEKVVITLLRSADSSSAGSPVEYMGPEMAYSMRVLTVPTNAAGSRSARVAYCLATDPYSATTTITAVFSGDERPHPYAPRHAAEKLVPDAKVDVVQGRSVAVPSGSLVSLVASLEHDMINALIRPGQGLTWGLRMPDETNNYWRTDSLRAAATATATRTKDGFDLPYAALQKGVRCVYDLKVVSYLPSPPSFSQYWNREASTARQAARATVRYSQLAFAWRSSRGDQSGYKWTIKTRVALLYALPISRLAAQAVLQYFCLAFATLITRTPHSSSDFAKAIFFPYPISEWFIIMGLICMVAVAGMSLKAKSEFVSGWKALGMLMLYPFLLLFRAAVDVYGQLDALVR